MASAGEPLRDTLEAVYFDTPDLALAARRISLRRHTGGFDEGWYVGIPLEPDRRLEFHAPLGQPDSVPEELMDRIRAYSRMGHVTAVASLSTDRATYRLYSDNGGRVADFVDDHVKALSRYPVPGELQWREWEVEPADDEHPELLAAVEAELLRTGASPADNSSELARVLGDLWPADKTMERGQPHRKGPAAVPVLRFLEAQVKELLLQDARVRLAEDDAVHEMRSVTRRIRSVLRTYRRFFRKATVKELDAGLKSLASTLGRFRDAEVLHERLRRNLAEQPDSLVVGPVATSIDDVMITRRDTARAAVMERLGSPRYFSLLDRLEDLVNTPELTPLASAPARRATAKLVHKAAKRLRKRQKKAARSGVGPERDIALHNVRKAAKQLRFAVQAVAPIHGKRAVGLEEYAHAVQAILGEHQDSTLARAQLRSLASSAVAAGDTALTYRRLYSAEQMLADNSEKEYERQDRGVLKRGLKKS